MHFILSHAPCVAFHIGLSWAWDRVKSTWVRFEQATLAPLYLVFDYYAALVSLFWLALAAGGIWLVFRVSKSK